MLLPSRLGLTVDYGSGFSDMRIRGSRESSHDSTWSPVVGERSLVRDRYNELTVELASPGDPARRIDVIFRAYDEGAAVSYHFPEQPGLEEFVITGETTRFRFSGDHLCYPVYSAQGAYQEKRLSGVKAGCERPLTVAVREGVFASIGEARLVDYARMRLRPARGEKHTLAPDLAGRVRARAPFTTPWRVVMVGESPGALLEQNYLFENLNEPREIDDVSWIRPGKVIRDISLTTDGAKACVDFAAAHGMQYIELDAGWYGPEGSLFSDARTVTLDRKRSAGPLDLHEVIAYGKEREVGVWLYVNRRQLERRREELFSLFQGWGVSGVKFGFVRVGGQRWTSWLHESVRSAARHRLMVDVHDEYRPTGYSRTYPNLLTQEGVRGNEEMPTAEHNLVLPFTRFVCGAADYTVCWNDPRIKTSRAHQLAMPVVFYSPLQFLYWYDRPEEIKESGELEFFDNVPVSWDETRVLAGEIGQYIIVARRNGKEWHIGVMNAVRERSLRVPLDFLEPGQKYKAIVHMDGTDDPRQADHRGYRDQDRDRGRRDRPEARQKRGRGHEVDPRGPLTTPEQD